MEHRPRHAFIVSDRTGLTAEAMAQSLLSQFPSIEFQTRTWAFTDTSDKAKEVIAECRRVEHETGFKPLVFITLVDDGIRAVFGETDIPVYDLFDTFIGPMEEQIGEVSSHTVGRSHGVVDTQAYTSRIAAVHFSMQTDDGMDTSHYGRAELIIVGVSRCGKTPTSLYLSMHYGIYASNYPVTGEELGSQELPESLQAHKHKLFGLTIDPFRLMQIRQERYADSQYSAIETCQREIAQVEAIFRANDIPYMNTTKMSVEEIGATIVHRTDLQRHI
ncbi:MAG: kinase/pyrophosphorylase [Gammaproteobacteria bacterium]|nr:kinase/pyrophosphorylase [Gammaproteobacteria bacterium]